MKRAKLSFVHHGYGIQLHKELNTMHTNTEISRNKGKGLGVSGGETSANVFTESKLAKSHTIGVTYVGGEEVQGGKRRGSEGTE